MLYFRINQPAAITLTNHETLRHFWQAYGHTALVGSITVSEPLTATQLRRLPAELRRALDNDGSIPAPKPVASCRPVVREAVG